MSDDLAFMPATTAAAMIRRGDISPTELVRASLRRIEEINPQLNAFCAIYAQEAVEAARQAERALARGEKPGLLHGLPIAFKDCTPIAGKVTTLGSRAYQDWRPNFDAEIVKAARQQGAIIIGKTTTPEFAYSYLTESPLHGITRNPWDPARTPGGSSGGSAVAVATGCVALAEGTDMGGSIRLPASFCGIVGLKPSLGRIPFTLLPSTFDSLSHFGPLARNCEDAALFLAAFQGPSESDIQSQISQIDFSQPLACDPSRLRVAFSRDLGFYALEPAVEQGLLAAVERLENAGCQVSEVQLAWSEEILAVWKNYWRVFMAAFYGEIHDRFPEKLDPAVVELIQQGRQISAVEYKQMEIPRTRWWDMLADILQEHDVLLCPTTATTAPLLADTEYNSDLADQSRYSGFDMAAPFNLFGQCPALSIPSGYDHLGLPTAIQIVGRRHDDLRVLQIGKLLDSGRLPQALPVTRP